MDKYELGIAVQKVYDFMWEEFCDWYIEMAKATSLDKQMRIRKRKRSSLDVEDSPDRMRLKLLHPYMPFITEEIYCTLRPEEESLS